MLRFALVFVLAACASLGGPTGAQAQDASAFLPVGSMAPDIQVAGATRYGVLSDPVKLSDFRGETLILAFFFRARSSG